MKLELPLFHITSGDIDGIGLEVSMKALCKLSKDLPQAHFIIWAHNKQLDEIKEFLSVHQMNDVCDFTSDILNKKTNKIFTFYLNNQNPATWFDRAVQDCLVKNADGIITAPLSKQETYSLGFKDLGHTDILRRHCKNTELHMAFIGSYFNVCLYSDHIELSQIKLDKQKFKNFINLCSDFNLHLSSKPGLSILGLNPHAGDQGLIGREDLMVQEWLGEWKVKFSSYLPADSAFVDYQNKAYSTYLSFYHDQGLIPFKMAHGFSGYQTSLGLPFIRTSVDHGTAKNLYGQNRANSTSMLEAIRGAVQLWKGQKNDES